MTSIGGLLSLPPIRDYHPDRRHVARPLLVEVRP